MAINFPGPFEVRFYYTTVVATVALNHIQRLSCAVAGDDPTVGTPFSSIDVGRRTGGPIGLDVAVDAYIALVTPFYSSGAGATWVRAELWQYPPESYDAGFISTYTIGEVGEAVSGPVAGSQSIVTMRTTNGGIFKYSFMESIIPPGVTDPGPIINEDLEALIADTEAGNQPWIGRDNGFPLARLSHFPGQNEALWKKRFRPAL
jgi:hypothetical protein